MTCSPGFFLGSHVHGTGDPGAPTRRRGLRGVFVVARDCDLQASYPCCMYLQERPTVPVRPIDVRHVRRVASHTFPGAAAFPNLCARQSHCRATELGALDDATKDCGTRASVDVGDHVVALGEGPLHLGAEVGELGPGALQPIGDPGVVHRTAAHRDRYDNSCSACAFLPHAIFFTRSSMHAGSFVRPFFRPAVGHRRQPRNDNRT